MGGLRDLRDFGTDTANELDEAANGFCLRARGCVMASHKVPEVLKSLTATVSDEDARGDEGT